MSSASATALNLSGSTSKSDSVVDLLASVEKIKMTNTLTNPLSLVFPQTIEPKTLRERFLYTTFEVVADLGADALSASELIKRTKSSKGALFHHFETIDHLCIESLNFFRRQISINVPSDNFVNLKDYMQHVLESNLARQSTKAYVHLVHFFRDRALRDERYRLPLKQLFEVHINSITDRVMLFLKPGVKREDIYAKVLFMSITIERAGFHRVLYQDTSAFQRELDQFMVMVLNDLNDLNAKAQEFK